MSSVRTKRRQGRVANILVIIRVLGTTGEDLIQNLKEICMKTISIQQQFDILLVAAATGVSKLEAIAAYKGWSFKTISTEKTEMVKEAVAKVTARRSIKLRKGVKNPKRSRKVAAFQRFAGRLVVAVNTTVDLTEQVRSVKAQSRAKAVAVQSYIKALSVATKATAKVREVKSKTVGWSVDLLKAMSRDAQAKVALEAAKAAL